jgi:hypothetical protein
MSAKTLNIEETTTRFFPTIKISLESWERFNTHIHASASGPTVAAALEALKSQVTEPGLKRSLTTCLKNVNWEAEAVQKKHQEMEAHVASARALREAMTTSGWAWVPAAKTEAGTTEPHWTKLQPGNQIKTDLFRNREGKFCTMLFFPEGSMTLNPVSTILEALEQVTKWLPRLDGTERARAEAAEAALAKT